MPPNPSHLSIIIVLVLGVWGNWDRVLILESEPYLVALDSNMWKETEGPLLRFLTHSEIRRQCDGPEFVPDRVWLHCVAQAGLGLSSACFGLQSTRTLKENYFLAGASFLKATEH